MRLKAKREMTYGGKLWMRGEIFDASETDGLQLIQDDSAEPFNLEDPSHTKRPEVEAGAAAVEPETEEPESREQRRG